MCLIHSFNSLKDFKLSSGLVLDKVEHIIYSVLSTKSAVKPGQDSWSYYGGILKSA